MKKNKLSQGFIKKLLFLKPLDEIGLDRKVEMSDYRENSMKAFDLWDGCFDNAKIKKWKSKTVAMHELSQQFMNYRSKALFQLLLLVILLSLINLKKYMKNYLMMKEIECLKFFILYVVRNIILTLIFGV